MLPQFKERINLYLSYFDVELTSSRSSLPTKKTIFLSNGVNTCGALELDERDSTIKSIGYESEITQSIIDKFIEFKKSNFKFGTIGTGLDFEYSGIEYISVDKFFEYLKQYNRDKLIENIINIKS